MVPNYTTETAPVLQVLKQAPIRPESLSRLSSDRSGEWHCCRGMVRQSVLAEVYQRFEVSSWAHQMLELEDHVDGDFVFSNPYHHF